MFNIIVIAKDQAQTLPDLLQSLKQQLPDRPRYFVLDRCTDNSAKYLYEMGETFVENNIGQGFLAGKARDLGLLRSGIDNTLFLDGDRVLNRLTFALVEQAFILYDLCLLRVEQDFRNGFKENFVDNPMFGSSNNDVFSCGMTVRKGMIERIIDIQQGRLFHENFDGTFGEEDRFLGDMVYKFKGSCGLFPNDCYLKGNFSCIKDKASYRKQVEKRKLLQKQYDVFVS